MFAAEKIELMDKVLGEFQAFWAEVSEDWRVQNAVPEEAKKLEAFFNKSTKDEFLLSALQLMITLDAMWCCYKLGHKVSNSKGKAEARFFCLWFAVTTGGGNLTDRANDDEFWRNWEDMSWPNFEILESSRSMFPNMACPQFELLELFSKSYQLADYAQQYTILLYRFSSVMAELDDCIDINEKVWLKELMARKDKVHGVQTHTFDDDDDPMKDLDAMIGMEVVKREIRGQESFIMIQKVREGKGMKTMPMSLHYIFSGNPGTGKTTVARILARMYKKLGVLEKGHLIEADRTSLVAEWEGQTEAKTTKVIDSALGGVLFIDEAYSLTQDPQDGFGKIVVDILLKRMEDDRDKLVVILAGYPNEMKDFVDSNPGLQSRFNRKLFFPNYSAEELTMIFMGLMDKYQYNASGETLDWLAQHLELVVACEDANFGNARYIRNLFEQCVVAQSTRLSVCKILSTAQLEEITLEDLNVAIEENE